MFAKTAENVGSPFLEKGVMLRVSKSKSWMKEKEPIIQNSTIFCITMLINDTSLIHDSTNQYDVNQRYVFDSRLDKSIRC
jgi:hypothetical protein